MKELFLICMVIVMVSPNLFSQRTVGVLEFNDAIEEGYTLIIPSSYNSTYLINNCGRIINEWDSEYTAGLMAYLLPDGRLLRAGKYIADFGAGGVGGIMEIFSWDGEIEWSYAYSDSRYQHHHDMEVLPNGNILLIAWVKLEDFEIFNTGRDEAYYDSDRGFWSEHVVELKPVGTDDVEIVWEWYSHDHYIQDLDSTKNNFGVVAEHPELLDVNYPYSRITSADWIHFNSIDYNEELDQILLGSRNFNEIYIIDHSTTTAEAASHEGGRYGKGGDILYRWGNPEVYKRGNSLDKKLYGQHDPHWLDTHNDGDNLIMIYNNGGGRLPYYSSVDVIDTGHDNGVYSMPEDEAYGPTDLSWTIPDLNMQFSSPRISGAQYLENKNTLICAGNAYRLVEVTPDGEVAWIYENPVSNFGPISQGEQRGGRDMFRAHKYRSDFSGFIDRDLTPGEVLVLNATEDGCNIMSVAAEEVSDDGIFVYPNPVVDDLTVGGIEDGEISYEIYNGAGLVVARGSKINNSIINLSDLSQGIYFIKIINSQNQNLFKIIKL
jgi:hypothetical protein